MTNCPPNNHRESKAKHQRARRKAVPDIFAISKSGESGESGESEQQKNNQDVEPTSAPSKRLGR